MKITHPEIEQILKKVLAADSDLNAGWKNLRGAEQWIRDDFGDEVVRVAQTLVKLRAAQAAQLRLYVILRLATQCR